ncbi:hypothetical protein [Streptomyces scopuliridis]|uniref:hypothetical protein n=1 Tax=Streptomyces scopuliridis TaxID=452529 RepID=UPI0035E19C0F
MDVSHSSVGPRSCVVRKSTVRARIEYATTGAGVSARIAEGSFPYFGGQQANKIFADSANNVGTGWSYLPYQVYANSVFNGPRRYRHGATHRWLFLS